jgi:hypothetical protein
VAVLAAPDGGAPSKDNPTANARARAVAAALGLCEFLRSGFNCWKGSNVFPVRLSSTILEGISITRGL